MGCYVEMLWGRSADDYARQIASDALAKATQALSLHQAHANDCGERYDDLKEEITGLRSEMSGLRSWVIGLVIGVAGAIITGMSTVLLVVIFHSHP